MKWMVLNIILESGSNVVHLVREKNQLSGIWKSPIIPLESEWYNIEIDITIPVEESSPADSKSRIYITSTINGKNSLVGMIENVDKEDGVHHLRLAPDCLIMIESNGLRLAEGHFYLLSVPIDALEFTPF